jgi:hypothetical protein
MILAALSLSAILASNSPIIQTPARNVAPAGGGGGGADVTENFEGAGYESAMIDDTGTPAEDTATTGLSLEASQCLYIDGNNGQEEAYVPFTASDNCYLYFMFRFEDMNSATRRQWALKNGTTTVAEMANAPGPSQWAIYDGGSGTDAGSFPSVDTTYHVWFEYEKGTGANGKIRFYVSTTTTKPGSPDCEITNSAETGQVNRFYPGTWGAGGGNIYFDKLRISRTAAFGSNPL